MNAAPRELTPLERAVLAEAFAGDAFAPLRAQVERAAVMARTPSGVGFVTKLEIPDGAPVSTTDLGVPPVYGRHPLLPAGAEFLIQVRRGQVNCIEAFCYEGIWPQDESGFALTLEK